MIARNQLTPGNVVGMRPVRREVGLPAALGALLNAGGQIATGYGQSMDRAAQAYWNWRKEQWPWGNDMMPPIDAGGVGMVVGALNIDRMKALKKSIKNEMLDYRNSYDVLMDKIPEHEFAKKFPYDPDEMLDLPSQTQAMSEFKNNLLSYVKKIRNLIGELKNDTKIMEKFKDDELRALTTDTTEKLYEIISKLED
jgi:uncharacterized protein YkvS